MVFRGWWRHITTETTHPRTHNRKIPEKRPFSGLRRKNEYLLMKNPLHAILTFSWYFIRLKCQHRKSEFASKRRIAAFAASGHVRYSCYWLRKSIVQLVGRSRCAHWLWQSMKRITPQCLFISLGIDEKTLCFVFFIVSLFYFDIN